MRLPSALFAFALALPLALVACSSDDGTSSSSSGGSSSGSSGGSSSGGSSSGGSTTSSSTSSGSTTSSFTCKLNSACYECPNSEALTACGKGDTSSCTSVACED